MPCHSEREEPGQTTIPIDDPAASSAAAVLGVEWIYPTDRHRVDWFRARRVVFGRGEECDVRLGDGATSRRHAEVLQDGPIHAVRDLGSTNGVFLNGVRVTDAVLSTGDVLRLGSWIGVLVRGDPGSEPPAARFRVEQSMVVGPVLSPVLDLVKRSARLDLPIVLEGETGTGKELMARAIHAYSGRPGQFLAVNCATLPEPLADALLFGHVKGAFTGANQAAPGHFLAAQHGTLFLDEVADLPPSLQPKLLRALEQREVVPVGSSRATAVDLQVVTATQVPLREYVAEQRFRRDLQARLEGVRIALMPLRARVVEIPYLFAWFLRKHSGGRDLTLDPQLVEALCRYDWPSNIRELELLARRLAGLYAEEPRLTRSHLPPEIARETAPSGAAEPAEGPGAQDARVLSQLARALRVQGGNISRAAAHVGISRQRAYRLMAAHPELDLDALRRASGPTSGDSSRSSGRGPA